MRWILKILPLPLILITWIIYAMCKLFVIASAAVLGGWRGLCSWLQSFYSSRPVYGLGCHGLRLPF